MIKIEISDNMFVVDFGYIKFSGLYPVVNNVQYRDITPVVKCIDSNDYELRYNLNVNEGRTFLVSISYLEDELLVQFHLEGCLDPSLIDSFGLH